MSISSSAEIVPSAAAYLRPGLFEGRQVLVAGGTSGIGAAVTEAFLALGADVLATGVADAEIEAASATPGLARARFARLDVRDNGAVTALVSGLPASITS